MILKFKKGVSILLSVMMLITCFTTTVVSANAATSSNDSKKIYLKPNANWKIDDARFAIYIWQNDDNQWISMENTDDSDYYEATIPEGNWPNIIFCRMNPANNTNNWTNKWNQTSDLTLQDNKNCYEVKEGTWDNGGGTWTNYTVEEPTTQEPTTQEPTTQEPTTQQPTTQIPTTTIVPTTQQPTEPSQTLKVNATSNLFNSVSQVYNTSDKTLTVTYKLTSSMNLINGQWTMTYDDTVLKYSDKNTVSTVMPVTSSGGIVNGSKANKVKGNFTSLSLFDFTKEQSFVSVVFDIVGTGETTVNLGVEYLGVSYVNTQGENIDAYIVEDSVIYDVTSQAGFENEKYTVNTVLSDSEVPDTTAPVTEQPTTAPVTEQPTTVPVTEQPTTAPVTEKPTTVPATEQPTTVPATEQPTHTSDKLKVNATSNLFNSVSQVYDESEKTLTVTYKLTSSMNLINGQWTMSYDNSVLKYSDSNTISTVMPITASGGIINGSKANKVKGNFTSLNLFDFTKEQNFVSVVFDIVGTGETTINLDVEYLGVSYIDSQGDNIDAYIIEDSKVYDITSKPGFENERYSVNTVLSNSEVPDTTVPVTEQPTHTSDTLKVNATSNLFNSVSQIYDESEKTLTVTYKLTSNMKVFNGQWTLVYDSTKLTYSSTNTASSVMPITINGGIVNGSKLNKVKGNFTSLNLYDFTSEQDFVKVTFDIIGTGETTIDLGVEYLSVAYLNNQSEVTEEYVVDDSIVKDITTTAGFENEKYNVRTLLSMPVAPTTEEPTQAPTTVAPTTEEPTQAPTTVAPTTEEPTQAPTTVVPTTEEPTQAPTTVVPTTEEPTEVPTTVAPTTEEPTQAPTTVVPTTVPSDTLKVNANSNFFKNTSQTYNSVDKTVTVSYKLTSNINLLNGQWTLTYDNTKLKYSSVNTISSVMPVTASGGIINSAKENKVKGNFTNLNLFDFTTEQNFVCITFDVVGTGETTINLNVEYLGVSFYNEEGETVDAYVVDDSVIKDVTSIAGFENLQQTAITTLNTPTVVEPLYGDVNNDGQITISDATLLSKYITHLADLDNDAIIRGDVNFDGVISITDVTLIKKYITKIIGSFK